MAERRFKEFHPLTEKTVAEYVAQHPELLDRTGGTPDTWSVSEVGDGNINFVYIVSGSKGSIVVKQALPYIRCVGESWPMALERINFEAAALEIQYNLVRKHVPEVYQHDMDMAIIAMEYLKPPNIILRKGLIQGLPYPLLADHMSTFLARTLFGTSLLANSTETFRTQVGRFCSNFPMCRLTEQVIFTEPYYAAKNNHWTTPQLDEDAKALREDKALKLEIAALKRKFCESTQALLHGDLHTGSIMVTEDSTSVIDPEFSFYGPMGFDIGAYLGNLLLAYFSQDGHATEAQPREEYKKWLLETFCQTWTLFSQKFRSLWTSSSKTLPKHSSPDSASSLGDGDGFSAGDAFSAAAFSDVVADAQDEYLQGLLADSLGFAGAKMIRRIVGIAHVEDLESIADADVRAKCERRALNAGKLLVKKRNLFKSPADALAAIEAL